MKKIRSLSNFETILKTTLIMIFCLHMIYYAVFSLAGFDFLLTCTLIEAAISLILFFCVFYLKKFINVATLFTHFDILFACCYATYQLGWGYGFSMVIVLLISLAYLQNFDNLFIPIFIAILEVLAFFVLLIFTKDMPNYESPYMSFINMANFIFMVFAVMLYIWLSDKEQNRFFKAINSSNVILQHKAEVDYLTDLPNRRAINSILTQKLKELKERKIQSVALAIGDLDNFKNLNDTYGHNFGDIVLKNVATIIKEQYENLENISFARWGGEEFLIVFFDVNYENCQKMLESTRASIEHFVHKDELNSVQTSISFGLSYTTKIYDMDRLITKADGALYTAKNSGKNQIISVNLG